jgi:sec-independent protein translocase protein TatA
MRFGFQELLVLLAIVLVIFGASRLPQLGKGLGEGIRNFKKGIKGEEPEALGLGASKGERQDG